jgi:hypothetical protein
MQTRSKNPKDRNGRTLKAGDRVEFINPEVRPPMQKGGRLGVVSKVYANGNLYARIMSRSGNKLKSSTYTPADARKYLAKLKQA